MVSCSRRAAAATDRPDGGAVRQILPADGESDDQPDQKHPDLALLSMQLARKFLFSTYFHTKKSLRGNMSDWLSTLVAYFKSSREARAWFACATNANIIRTYLLECPVEEVRHFFAYVLATLCHSLLNESTATTDDEPPNQLAQKILNDVMQLLVKDVCEYGRHVNQYFLFYSLYAETGNRAKEHLIKNDVPLAFIRLALEEGAIKYQYA